MSYQFRPAIREQVGLLMALSGASGSGKTFSAMRLAAGIVGPGNRFAVIDTEARRALHYADQFAFDHAELKPPFTPDSYIAAIEAADKAGYGAIVIDSMSHSWAGTGGVLDMQEAELQRMAGDDYGKRERVKLASWIKPKMAHKRMVARLLQTRAHLICCMRAEEKVKMEKVDGKNVIVPIGWVPTCAKDFMFEMTASFLLTPDKPGIGQPVKLQAQHRPLFPTSKPIDESCGQAIAAWAKGGAAPQQSGGSPAVDSAAPASDMSEAERVHALMQRAEAEADKGLAALETFWNALSRTDKLAVQPQMATLKSRAGSAAGSEAA